MPFKVKKKSVDYSSFDAAINLISYRARSESEIRTKLAERDFSEEEITKAIVRLKEYRYLDDLQFAKDLSASRIRVKHWGPLKVSFELMSKGISRDIIDSVLTDYSDEKQLETTNLALESWLRKKRLTPPPLLDEKNKQKAIRHLQSRGFTGKSVFTAIDCLNKKI